MLKPSELNIALRFARSRAAEGTPGFVGFASSYPSVAISTILQALNEGLLVSANKSNFSNTINDDQGTIGLLVETAAGWRIAIVARDPKPLLFKLLADGWQIDGHTRLLSLPRDPTLSIDTLREKLEAALKPNAAATAMGPPVSQEV